MYCMYVYDEKRQLLGTQCVDISNLYKKVNIEVQ